MNLPLEINWKIALFTPIETLMTLCEVNSLYNEFCSKENFWKEKLINDFSLQFAQQKPSNLSWKQAYLKLAKRLILPLPVYFKSQRIGEVWMNQNNTRGEVYNNVLVLFRILYPRIPEENLRIDILSLNRQTPILGYFNAQNIQTMKDIPVTQEVMGKSMWKDVIGFNIYEFK